MICKTLSKFIFLIFLSSVIFTSVFFGGGVGVLEWLELETGALVALLGRNAFRLKKTQQKEQKRHPKDNFLMRFPGQGYQAEGDTLTVSSWNKFYL